MRLRRLNLNHLLSIYFFLLASFLYYGFAAGVIRSELLQFLVYLALVGIPFGLLIDGVSRPRSGANES